MLTKFDSKSNRVKGLSFHPKRPWIIASLHNGVLQLWDYRMGTLLEKYEEHEGPVRGVDFHYTQPLFVSGGDDYKIKVWNYKLRRCLFTLLGHLDYIRTVMFHHEHPWLVSASDDQTIRLWNWQSRTCISVLTGHNHYVMCAQFHPKEELIVSASLDQTVRVWDTTALSRKGTRSGPQTEDSSTSALGRAGRSMAAELFPTGGDVVVKYVLEGHDRGANWAAFHPTQSLIVSGADDRQVKLWRMSDSKAWEMDTLRGHTNNVSCVLFHTRHDLVISNSEDKSIRVWDTQKRTCVQTFRREQDRFWMLAAHPEQNLLAAGHDSGMVVFKLEKERPAFASSGNGALLYVRDRYLRQATLGSAKDLSLCALRGRPAGPFGGAPRGMTLNLFNPGEDNVLITFSADGGTYELYTLPAAGGAGGVSPSVAAAATSNQEPSRGAGMAAVFTARNKFAVLDKVARSIVVKGFTPGDVGKKVKPPYPNADFLFPSSTPGHVLVRAEDRLGLFDLQARKLMSELTGVTVKYVVWSADGNYVALLGKHAVLLADKQLTQICSTTETVRVKGGAWDEYGVFLYATLNHIKYLLPIPSGESGIVRTLEAPVYPVEARGGIMYALDRDTRVRAVPVDATEHTFKLALARRQYEKVLNIIKGAKLCGQAVIAYLQKAGCPEVALLFVEDEGTRFNLALQCGNLDIALRAAKSLNSEEAWLRLAGAAVSQGALDVAEAAYVTVKNLSRLSMLYHCVGAQEKLGRLAGVASRGDPTARFQMSLLTGDVGERVKALEAAGQISLAFVTASVGGLVEEAARLKSYLDTAKLAVPEIKASYQPLAPLKPTAPLASMRLPRAQAKSGPKGLDLKAIAAAAAAAGEAAAAPGGSGSLGAGAAERAASVASAAMASAAAAAKEEEAARVAAAKAAKAAGASGEDGEDGGWGDDDDLGEDGEGEEGGGEGAGEGGGWGDDEDIGLGELEVQQAAQAAERAAAAAAAAKAGASGGGKSGVWAMPAGGASPASLWVRNSILAGDHAAAGSYESAAQLLHRQIGIVNFNPLRPGFRAAFLAAKASMPTLPGLPSMSLAIQRGGLDSAPPREATLPASLVSLATLTALQTKVHAAFTEGKFTEVRDTVDTLFSVIPLCIAHTREEAEGVKSILTSATQYKVAVCCVQASRQGGEGDAKRQVELAAYATHCQLEPNHIILVLNLALTHAFKHKNFIHAAGFARRLIELPEASSAKNATFVSKAKTVLQKSESEARNAMTLDYDDRSSFHLCAGSLTPIAKGAPFLRSPYSAAYYKPEFKGTVCVVDGMSQVGVETIGLVCLQQKK